MRSLVAAAIAGVVLAGCGGTPPPAPAPDPLDSIDPSLDARPTSKPQPLLEINVGPEVASWTVVGWSKSTTGGPIWDQTMKLVREWMFKPSLVQNHDVKKGELDGLTQFMTDDAAKRWKRQTAKTLSPWIFGSNEKHSIPNEYLVSTLCAWQTGFIFGTNRGWQNPMYAPAEISNAAFFGGADNTIRLQFNLSTTFLLRGEGKTFERPYVTAIFLDWVRVDGSWQLDNWARQAEFGTEEVTGPPDAVRKWKAEVEASESAAATASASPSASPSPSPSATNFRDAGTDAP